MSFEYLHPLQLVVKATTITIFAIVAAFSLVTANSLVIQIFAQNKTVNTTLAAGNMTNASGSKTTSPEPPTSKAQGTRT